MADERQGLSPAASGLLNQLRHIDSAAARERYEAAHVASARLHLETCVAATRAEIRRRGRNARLSARSPPPSSRSGSERDGAGIGHDPEAGMELGEVLDGQTRALLLLDDRASAARTALARSDGLRSAVLRSIGDEVARLESLRSGMRARRRSVEAAASEAVDLLLGQVAHLPALREVSESMLTALVAGGTITAETAAAHVEKVSELERATTRGRDELVAEEVARRTDAAAAAAGDEAEIDRQVAALRSRAASGGGTAAAPSRRGRRRRKTRSAGGGRAGLGAGGLAAAPGSGGRGPDADLLRSIARQVYAAAASGKRRRRSGGGEGRASSAPGAAAGGKRRRSRAGEADEGEGTWASRGGRAGQLAEEQELAERRHREDEGEPRSTGADHGSVVAGEEGRGGEAGRGPGQQQQAGGQQPPSDGLPVRYVQFDSTADHFSLYFREVPST